MYAYVNHMDEADISKKINNILSLKKYNVYDNGNACTFICSIKAVEYAQAKLEESII